MHFSDFFFIFRLDSLWTVVENMVCESLQFLDLSCIEDLRFYGFGLFAGFVNLEFFISICNIFCIYFFLLFLSVIKLELLTMRNKKQGFVQNRICITQNMSLSHYFHETFI